MYCIHSTALIYCIDKNSQIYHLNFGRYMLCLTKWQNNYKMIFCNCCGSKTKHVFTSCIKSLFMMIVFINGWGGNFIYKGSYSLYFVWIHWDLYWTSIFVVKEGSVLLALKPTIGYNVQPSHIITVYFGHIHLNYPPISSKFCINYLYLPFKLCVK